MLGEKIRRIIRYSGFSQKEIAKKIDITENTLTNYVKGRAVPDACKLAQLAEICDADLYYLLSDSQKVDSDIPKYGPRSNNPQDIDNILTTLKEEFDKLKQRRRNK